MGGSTAVTRPPVPGSSGAGRPAVFGASGSMRRSVGIAVAVTGAFAATVVVLIVTSTLVARLG